MCNRFSKVADFDSGWKNFGVEAGKTAEGTNEDSCGELILLSRTRGLALSVSWINLATRAAQPGYGIGSDCEKRNTVQLCGWDVYEFVPEAITSMETVKRRNMDDYMHYQGYKLPCKSAIEKSLAFKSALLTSTKASFVRSNFIARVSTASL